MRIKNVKIENFGKWSDVSFDFANDFQVFCEDNGWGKSTLASFLCVMFYGFSGEKKRDELANERKRYEPWQKGVYGGSVVFEVEGKEYQLSRIFGKKEAEDEFSLRLLETNRECEDYSANIGEELFQIDRESFCRTIFLSQQDCETYATDNINAKIGNLIHHTDDVNNFATAYGKIKDVVNSMRPNHKKGTLKQQKEEIGALETKIRDEETLAKRMEDTTALRMEQIEKKEEIQQSIVLLEQKQKEMSKDLDMQAVRAEYKGICENLEEEKQARLEILSLFADADNIPTENDVEEWRNQEKICRELAGFVKINTLSEEEEDSYQRLHERWGEECPTEEKVESMEQSNQQRIKLRREIIAYGLSEEEKVQLEELEKKYVQGFPGEAQLEQLQNQWEEARRKEETLLTKKATLATLTQMNNEKKKVPILLLVGIAVVLLGVATAFVDMRLMAIVVTLGILCSLGAILKNKNANNPMENEELSELKEQVEEDERYITQAHTEIETFLATYDTVSLKNNIETCLSELLADVKQSEYLYKKQGDASVQERIKFAEQLETTIRDFLGKYAFSVQSEDNWATQLANIRTECGQMKQWIAKKADWERAKVAYDKQLLELQEQLSEFGYEVSEGDVETLLRALHQNVSDYNKIEERYQKIKRRKEEFEETHDMKSVEDKKTDNDNNDTLANLTEDIRRMREEQKMVEQLIREYDTCLAADQEQWDMIQETKLELSEKQEQLESGLQKYEQLTKTMELLQLAKDNLTAKYLQPVKNGFEKYYQMITQKNATDYYFDAGVNLTVMEKGLQRDTKFLSEGYQDLLGICTRLALVDAMYAGEKPFLILDDPFVNLDKEKTERALSFLKKVSEEYQVIYFTCHESRKETVV